MRSLLKNSHDLTRLVRRLRIWRWRRDRGPAITAYLSSHAVRKLQLGCGDHLLEGWLNTDFEPAPGRVHLDAAGEFPLPSDSFDVVFTEHSIEHVQYREALAMLRECHRVLRAGGRIRVATPDLDAYVGFLRAEPDALERECIAYFFNDWIRAGFHAAKDYVPVGEEPSAVFVLNDLFRNYEHRFIYDYGTLAELMRAAGFAEVERKNVGASDEPLLAGLEAHRDRINAFITLVVEARKP